MFSANTWWLALLCMTDWLKCRTTYDKSRWVATLQGGSSSCTQPQEPASAVKGEFLEQNLCRNLAVTFFPGRSLEEVFYSSKNPNALFSVGHLQLVKLAVQTPPQGLLWDKRSEKILKENCNKHATHTHAYTPDTHTHILQSLVIYLLPWRWPVEDIFLT
jgi:hypothetical protein